MTAAGAMIEASDVSKWFGDVVAVSEVSFTIGPGVTAMLGPNGAGKSTLLRLISGLATPSRGTVRVLGHDPHRDVEVTHKLGIVPQQEGTFEHLSALEFVSLAAVLQGLARPDNAARRALHTVDLDPDDPRRLTAYSKGMRQRVKVAQALVHNPQVIVLDEPLTGLDPRQRLHLVDLFRRLGEEGRCVVVSSHVLDEVERFGSRVLVVARGRLAAEGDFHAIRELMDDRPHRIRVRTDRPRRIGSWLVAIGAATGVHVTAGDTLLVETDDIASFRRKVAGAARHVESRLFEVTPLDEDLDSVFRYLVDD